MTERGLVEVPENAVRDEPLAFGLTASQLLLCGAAVGIGAACAAACIRMTTRCMGPPHESATGAEGQH